MGAIELRLCGDDTFRWTSLALQDFRWRSSWQHKVGSQTRCEVATMCLPRLAVKVDSLSPHRQVAPHPSGGNWTLIGGSIETIPTITMQERNALHNLFAMFDQMPKVESIQADVVKRDDSSLSAGDDYNAKVTWESILEPLGWTKVYSKADATAWRRQGEKMKAYLPPQTSTAMTNSLYFQQALSSTLNPHTRSLPLLQIEHNASNKQPKPCVRRDMVPLKS